jgi:hypothetical protein
MNYKTGIKRLQRKLQTSLKLDLKTTFPEGLTPQKIQEYLTYPGTDKIVFNFQAAVTVQELAKLFNYQPPEVKPQ